MNNRSKTAYMVLLLQLAITLIATIAVFSLADVRAAVSAAAGGAISIVATMFFGLRLFAVQKAFSAERFLQRFLRAELQKIVLTVVLLLLALLKTEASALPLMMTFLSTFMAYWLVLLIKI